MPSFLSLALNDFKIKDSSFLFFTIMFHSEWNFLCNLYIYRGETKTLIDNFSVLSFSKSLISPKGLLKRFSLS